MEHDKHHELIRPIVEIAQTVGGLIVSKVSELLVPEDVFDDFMQGGASQLLDEALDGDS